MSDHSFTELELVLLTYCWHIQRWMENVDGFRELSRKRDFTGLLGSELSVFADNEILDAGEHLTALGYTGVGQVVTELGLHVVQERGLDVRLGLLADA